MLKTLDRIAKAQEEQTVCLRRIAQHLVPEYEEPSDGDLTVSAGVSYTQDQEQTHLQDLTDRFVFSTGRVPTDDELVQLLEGREP